MTSTGIRWADSSDEESEDEYILENQYTEPAGLNDGSIRSHHHEDPSSQVPDDGGVEDFSSDEGSDVESESESSSDEEEDPQSGTTEKAELPKEEIKKKIIATPLTKQEKLDLKAKELDDLDSLLNEMGIAAPEKVEEEPSPPIITTEAKIGVEKSGTAKRKKKKKKGKAKAGAGEAVNAPEVNGQKVVDVAAVMKAKAKPKEKSAAEIAAATAAKEAKAKKEKADKLKKKKRKKKDKYAHGAPSR